MESEGEREEDDALNTILQNHLEKIKRLEEEISRLTHRSWKRYNIRENSGRLRLRLRRREQRYRKDAYVNIEGTTLKVQVPNEEEPTEFFTIDELRIGLIYAQSQERECMSRLNALQKELIQTLERVVMMLLAIAKNSLLPSEAEIDPKS